MREYLCIGKIVKPQGIRGEVKVTSFTDDPERFLKLTKIWLGEGGEQARVVSARVSGQDVFLLLEGVADRNAAEALRDKELFVDREHAVKLPKGRYFIADLIGLAVLDETGAKLGRLEDVSQAGGNDVYSVKGPRDFLFPALKRVIERIDPENGIMVLRSQALAQVAVYSDED